MSLFSKGRKARQSAFASSGPQSEHTERRTYQSHGGSYDPNSKGSDRPWPPTSVNSKPAQVSSQHLSKDPQEPHSSSFSTTSWSQASLAGRSNHESHGGSYDPNSKDPKRPWPPAFADTKPPLRSSDTSSTRSQASLSSSSTLIGTQTVVSGSVRSDPHGGSYDPSSKNPKRPWPPTSARYKLSHEEMIEDENEMDNIPLNRVGEAPAPGSSVYVKRHTDAAGRVLQLALAQDLDLDRYIRPSTWELAPLVVQATQQAMAESGETTWCQVAIRKSRGQRWLRVACWPFNYRKVAFGAAYLASSFATPIAGIFPDGAREYHRGGYHPFPYRYRGFTKTPANAFEQTQYITGQANEKSSPAEIQLGRQWPQRSLLPKRLTFFTGTEPSGRPTAMTEDTNSWLGRHPSNSGIPYMFVSFTSQHFDTTDNEMLALLDDLAMMATKHAQLPAYWSSYSVMDAPDLDGFQEDVYRISDAVRVSSRVCIIVNDRDDDPGAEKRLAEWGSRSWTFPEILLAPAHQMIDVWSPSCSNMRPLRSIPKNQFAALVWGDAPESRKLIDHFEGNLILSRLQLQIIALKCLYNRSTVHKGQGQYLPGDKAYALAGLLHSGIRVSESDSEFQAFAALSLANDSNKLLERLMCVQPVVNDQKFYNMDDAWGVQPWDIEPLCEVAAICDGDTVLLDGLRAASVRWHSFGAVAPLGHFLSRRFARQIVLVSSVAPLLLFIGIALLAVGGAVSGSGDSGSGDSDSEFEGSEFSGSGVPDSPFLAVGAILFALGVAGLAFLPITVRRYFRSFTPDRQAWLFGFEGTMELEAIENLIWPEAPGRLRWAALGSPISRYTKDPGTKEFIGINPLKDPDHANEILRIRQERGLRIFTIVDTVTLTATVFLAKRPPIAFLMCGSEGGMLRAVGVSYDWTTQTVYRECVLRMETQILDRVHRAPRCRFGFGRAVHIERTEDLSMDSGHA